MTESSTTTLRQASGQIPYLGRALTLIWSSAPSWAIVWTLLLVVQSLLPVAAVYLTRELVNATVVAIDTSGTAEAVRTAVLLAIALGAVLAAQEVLRGVGRWVRAGLSDRVRDAIADLIQERALAVDLAFYDLPDFYDRQYRASQEASYRPVALLENIGMLFQNGLTLVAMMFVLLPYGWWLPLALLASTIPAVLVVLRNAERRHAWRREVTPDERRSWYYNWLITTRENAPELRLHGLGDTFRQRYQAVRIQLRDYNLKLARREGLAQLVAGLVALLVVGLTMIFMLWQVVQGVLTLGDLALIYQALTQGQNLMRGLLQSVGEIYENSLFLSDLFSFLALEPTVKDPEQAATFDAGYESAVQFSDVSFTYPGAERPALEHFSLDVPTGKTVAIVGSNGAGKSTLIKLLARFYDPQQGAVMVFDRDVRDVEQHELRRQLSVLFQTPVQFHATARENITLSYVAEDATTSGLNSAIYQAGAEPVINRLANGLDSRLGVWFLDGTDLSVGEWRRIALARALYRPAPILVLDEPTSAMDPWAETEWIRRFRAEGSSKTKILITHRFTTARHADLICVMESGRVIEQGTHDELVALGGRYAQSWADQVQASHSGGNTP